MNTKLLRRVKKHILEEPKRWSFSWYVKSDESPCGTKACIAGWTVAISDGMEALKETYQYGDVCERAAKLLNLPYDTSRRLFVHWLTRPDGRVFNHDEPSEAAEYIEHFIKQNTKKRTFKSKKTNDLPSATT